MKWLQMIIAVAIVGGWFLRILAERHPDWSGILILATLTLVNALTWLAARVARKPDPEGNTAPYLTAPEANATEGGERS